MTWENEGWLMSFSLKSNVDVVTYSGSLTHRQMWKGLFLQRPAVTIYTVTFNIKRTLHIWPQSTRMRFY
jgi:hypothetical protein